MREQIIIKPGEGFIGSGDIVKRWMESGKAFVLECKDLTRTVDQNAKMWAVLSDISKHVDWYGQKLEPEEWKHVLSASLEKQKVVPGIDGGFVVMGKSTSTMTVKQLCDLIELAQAFGAQQGVMFGDDARRSIDWAMAKRKPTNG